MFETILIDEFMGLRPQYVIDVREADEYASGHIQGSVNMPLSTFEQTISQLDPATPYYVVCRSGARSQKACVIAAACGLRVTNVLGGVSAYRGHLVETAKK